MLKAYQLARQRLGYCAPNPTVGCVLVKNNQIIATGVHMAHGQPHAEAQALSLAKDQANGCTVYVTLTPCAHFGQTPPCAKALIAAKVGVVYYAFEDPNPKAQGGVALLEQAGIACHLFPLPEITRLYQPFVRWLKTGEASLTAKIALSLDGKYALPSKKIQITSDEFETYTAQQRLKHDVIVTSVNTVKVDNPRLNVRLPQKIISKPVIVLDPFADISLSAQLLKTAKQLYILHTECADKDKIDQLNQLDICCIQVARESNGRILTSQIPKVIGNLGFHTAWVETGGQWFTSMLSTNIFSKIFFYYGNILLGNSAMSLPLSATYGFAKAEKILWDKVGNEVYCKIILN